VTDGCFYGNKGIFRVAPRLELEELLVPFRIEAIFQHNVVSDSAGWKILKRQKEDLTKFFLQ